MAVLNGEAIRTRDDLERFEVLSEQIWLRRAGRPLSLD